MIDFAAVPSSMVVDGFVLVGMVYLATGQRWIKREMMRLQKEATPLAALQAVVEVRRDLSSLQSHVGALEGRTQDLERIVGNFDGRLTGVVAEIVDGARKVQDHIHDRLAAIEKNVAKLVKEAGLAPLV